MLSELHIENIAVIERADISFGPGLNVLGGETGSGKSIIIDSINAVLGNRTSREIVRKGAESAVVTAVFEMEQALPWFEENDIPFEEEVILQRRINAAGKTSSRVSGLPVTTAQLRALASELVDIHGQNDGLRLLDEFREAYRRFTALQKELKTLTMDDEEKQRLSDSLRFRIGELENAALKAGEYEELSARRDLLRNSEKLRDALDAALALLYDGEDNAVTFTQNAQYYAERAARMAPDLESAVSSMKEASFLLSDASESLNDFRESLDFSPEEYDRLETRVGQIDRLSRKYNRDAQGLMDLLEESRLRLNDIEYSEDRILKLQQELEAQRQVCLARGEKLSEARRLAAKELQKRVVQELKELNMPSVRFVVDFAPVDSMFGFVSDGIDDVRFLMSANAGEDLGRISRIASGGELSRIMLALKNVFAEHDAVQTMIFDEIDTGVSGIAAQRVAEKLYSVSKNKQVMCVTHLPQIAAMADREYLVSKSETGGRTFTQVSLLDNEGRKNEIARLYGGDHITSTTLSAAAEQLSAAGEFKQKR